jgi:glycine cleavage system regulatory protein
VVHRLGRRRDRPGIVADLAQLVFDCEANLEDSRMTLLGNEFAAILLVLRSGAGSRRAARAARGARSGRTA